MGTNKILPNKAIWHFRIEQKDGSYKVDRELVDLFLDIVCKRSEWTDDDTELFVKIKEYHKFYKGKLMYSKINDVNNDIHTFMQLVLPIRSDSYNEQIETALRKIGKKNYVKYYRLFQNNPSKDCKDALLKDGFSENSINTIVSAAKQLFSESKNIEALRNIIASSKVDDTLREQAINLL